MAANPEPVNHYAHGLTIPNPKSVRSLRPCESRNQCFYDPPGAAVCLDAIERAPGYLTMMLSVIIPCYNEAATIEQAVKAVSESSVEPKEIIVMDDGSTDGTQEILKSIVDNLACRVVCRARNQGKGAAIRSGFRGTSPDFH